MIIDEYGRPMQAVHECWSDIEADVVISCLGAHGISAWANSEVPHAVLPITVDGLGKVEVLVMEEDAEQARVILAERLQHRDADDASGTVAEEDGE